MKHILENAGFIIIIPQPFRCAVILRHTQECTQRRWDSAVRHSLVVSVFLEEVLLMQERKRKFLPPMKSGLL